MFSNSLFFLILTDILIYKGYHMMFQHMQRLCNIQIRVKISVFKHHFFMVRISKFFNFSKAFKKNYIIIIHHLWGRTQKFLCPSHSNLVLFKLCFPISLSPSVLILASGHQYSMWLKSAVLNAIQESIHYALLCLTYLAYAMNIIPSVLSRTWGEALSECLSTMKPFQFPPKKKLEECMKMYATAPSSEQKMVTLATITKANAN